jgi:hypothetical protein
MDIVGDGHRGLLNNRGKPIFLSQTTKHKRTHNTIKCVQDDRGPVAGAHGPGGLSGPPEQTGPTPLGRNSVSLEQYGTTLIKLRLARGLDAPSGETPPRSRAGPPLVRDSASLEALVGSPLPHLLPRPEHLMF